MVIICYTPPLACDMCFLSCVSKLCHQDLTCIVLLMLHRILLIVSGSAQNSLNKCSAVSTVHHSDDSSGNLLSFCHCGATTHCFQCSLQYSHGSFVLGQTVSLLLQRARQQRSEAKAKKAEGQRKNTKVQQISNPATIKKMMKDKKQRKKLMTVDPANAAKGHA